MSEGERPEPPQHEGPQARDSGQSSADRPESEQPQAERPQSTWEAEGSIVERLKTTRIDGSEPERSSSSTGGGASPSTPAEQAANPSLTVGARYQAADRSGGVTHNNPGAAPRFMDQIARHDEPDPKAERRYERVVSMLFLVSAGASIGFVITYFVVPQIDLAYTPLLGISMAIALASIGAALVVWAKKLLPHEEAVQEREMFGSTEQARAEATEVFEKGTAETGIARRSLLRRSALVAVGFFGLPFVVPLLSLGRYQFKERALSETPWRKGVRLVDYENVPVKLGDIPLGGLLTVFPEGHTSQTDDGPTILIRLYPGEDHPLPGRENWGVDGHVAYSKICTHAGCPVGLYEKEVHHLLCPCHQSTFLVTKGCEPIFGPATRPLPQLAIYADENNYLRAQGDYSEPVGPGYWERG